MDQHPYMTIVLFLTALFLIALAVCPRKQRRFMIFSALLSAPFSLYSFIFDPEYWHPLRIIAFPFSPEDVFFSFATGGLAWFLAVSPVQSNIIFDIRYSMIFKRYLAIILCGSIVSIVFRIAGASIMSAALSGIASVIIYTLRFKRPLWMISCTGMIGFTAIYAAVMKAGFLIFPTFHEQWNLGVFWSVPIWGIPVGELAWALVFGAAWPLVTGYMFDARPNGRDAART